MESMGRADATIVVEVSVMVYYTEAFEDLEGSNVGSYISGMFREANQGLEVTTPVVPISVSSTVHDE